MGASATRWQLQQPESAGEGAAAHQLRWLLDDLNGEVPRDSEAIRGNDISGITATAASARLH